MSSDKVTPLETMNGHSREDGGRVRQVWLKKAEVVAELHRGLMRPKMPYHAAASVNVSRSEFST
jgi:hypothetical protein